MTRRFPCCTDCAFNHVEPAICDECHDADQFQEENREEQTPLYFIDWKET